MAVTVDVTDAKELTLAVNNDKDSRRFLASFFKPLDHQTRDIMIDFVEGSQKLAPFVRDGDSATVSHRGGYKSRFVHAYGIELKRPTHAFDCLKRLPGEAPIYSGKAVSPSVRAAELAGRDLKDLKNRVYRTVEKIISDGFFGGKFDITDKDGNKIDSVDLGRSSSHVLTKEWGASYDGISTDLDDMATLINEDSGLTATDVILGKTAHAKIQKNTKFMKDLDTKNLDGVRAAMNFKMEGIGARLVGVIGGLRVWRYDEVFKNAAGDKVSIIPANGVLMLSDEMQATLHRGIVGDNDIGWFEGEFAADTWYEKDPSVQWLRLRSAPLPICEQIDATCVATIA